MKDKFKNEHIAFFFDIGLLSEHLEQEEKREKREKEVLGIACLVLGKGSLSTADERVIKFIDDLFSQDENLAKAWVFPGFPFQELNDIYKSLAGNDHPIFLELFGNSFIAGIFLGGKEEPGHVINVSQSRIPCIHRGVAYNVPILEHGQA